ncbi:MAG: tRNA (adenosine(37)-N6)-threonylcarbamoyltransferase complex ATPase subunit type 1 TsaE [Chloroflexota bacterium]
MTSVLDITTDSPRETQEIGKSLGSLLRGGEVIYLVGGLGAGKTCLTQGIAWGVGVQEFVRSPTFVLVNQYRGRLTLYHVDLYRLESAAEVLDLGLEEVFAGQGVSVVEWADRAPTELAPEHLRIELTTLGPERRRLRLVPAGADYETLVHDLRDILAKGSRV